MKRVFDAIRDSVKHYLENHEIKPLEINRTWLADSKGVFVTFRDDKGIRGSMGFLDTDRPLKIAINDCAIAAATDDPRYKHLGPEEVDDVVLEVTIIDNIYPKSELKGEFIKGFHGIYVESDFNAGILLPHEILLKNLSLEDAIDYARIKAGILHSDDIKQVLIFDAHVYVQKRRGKSVKDITRAVLKNYHKQVKKSKLSFIFGGNHAD